MSQKLIKRHARLVDQIATTLGVDLEEATMQWDLPMCDLSDLVVRYTGFSDLDACENWLKMKRFSAWSLRHLYSSTPLTILGSAAGSWLLMHHSPWQCTEIAFK